MTRAKVALRHRRRASSSSRLIGSRRCRRGPGASSLGFFPFKVLLGGRPPWPTAHRPAPPEGGRRNGASVRTRLPAQCGRRARASPCGRERGDAAPDGPAPGGLADRPRAVGVPCVDDGRSHRSDASDRGLASEVGPIRTESLRRFVRAGELIPATAAEALGGSARLGCPSRAGRCR